MYESLQSELNNKMSMAQAESNTQAQRIGNIGQTVNTLTQAVNQGFSAYAQSTINKDKYDLKQKLIAGQQDYLNVDNENASNDYADWVNRQLDEYMDSKGALAKGYFRQYKQSFLDEARESFDTKLLTQLDSRNKLNSITTWDKAINLAATEGFDALDTMDMPDVFTTTFSADGMKVTHDRVKIQNLYDTTSGELSDKEKGFNKLLNVLYESQCLVMDQDSAKAYVESKKIDIENSFIKNEIIGLINDWTELGVNGDGTGYLTQDEMARELSLMYIPGGDRPFTDGKFTADDVDSIYDTIDEYVTKAYDKKYAENNRIITGGLDGKLKEWDELDVAMTTDVLLPELQRLKMVTLDENGNLVNHFGIDDKTWAALENIMEHNDIVLKANEWASNPVDSNKNGYLDIGDVPSEIIKQIEISSGNTSAYVNEDWQFIVDFNGVTEMASSTYAEYIRQSNAQKVAEIVRDYGTEYYTFNGGVIGTQELDSILNTLGFTDDDIAGISDLRAIAKQNDVAREASRIAQALNDLPEDVALQRYNEYVDPKSDEYLFGVFENVSRDDNGNWVSSATYKDLNGWKFSNSSVIDAYVKSESVKLNEEAERQEYLKTANELLNDFVVYTQNSANGLDIPKENKIASFIDEGLRQKFGDDYKNKANTQEYNEYKASLEAEILTKFTQAMRKSGDDDFQAFAKQFEASYGANAETTRAILDEAQRLAAKSEISGVEAYYVKFNEDMTILSNNPTIDSATWPTDAAKAVLEVANSNIETQLRMLGWEGTIDSLIPSSARAEIMRRCNELGQDYDFTLRLAQNNALVQRLQSMSNYGNPLTNEEYIKACADLAYVYNGLAIDKVSSLAKDNYNSYKDNLKESDITKNLSMKTYEEIQKDAQSGTVGEISSRFNTWKPVNSVGDWRTRYTDLYKRGNSLEYIKEVAKADIYLSEKNTDDILKMVDSDFFQWITDDPSLTTYVNGMAKTLPTIVSQDYFWDSVVNAVINRQDGDDARQVVSNAINDFMSSYGVKLSADMYTFNDGSTVYYRPEFGTGQAASKETRNIINKYESQYVAGDFASAGINAMVNNTLNSNEFERKGGIAGIVTSIIGDGKDEDAIYRACVMLALETEGMGVGEFDIFASDKDFWEKVEDKYPALSINNDEYDARFADHTLRVAGAWKSILKNYTDKYTDVYGVPGVVDAESGRLYNYDSFTQKAYDDGVYVQQSSGDGKDANYLVYSDDTGEHSVNMSILNKDKLSTLSGQICDEAENVRNQMLYDQDFLMNYFYNYSTLPDSENGAPLGTDDLALLYLSESETYKKFMADVKVISTYLDVTIPIPSISIAGHANVGKILFGFVDGTVDDFNNFSKRINGIKKYIRDFNKETRYADQYMSEQAQADEDRNTINERKARENHSSILGEKDYSNMTPAWARNIFGGN